MMGKINASPGVRHSEPQGSFTPRTPKGRNTSPWGLRLSALVAALCVSASAAAEEIHLQDGKRLMAMVEAVSADGKMTLRLPSGKTQTAELTQVISITFRGREPRAIRAGAQEFHFVAGDRLKGQMVQMSSDTLIIDSPSVGTVPVPMAALRGFVTMPIAGKAGRRAIELVAGDDDEPTGKMDQILDRRSASYEGVIEAIDAKTLLLDHERLRQTVPLSILHLAGVRLARDTTNPRPPLPNQPFIKVHTRDESSLDGVIESVQHGKWHLRPLWQPGKVLSIPVEEVTSVEVLNGQAIYVSQLQPSKVQEKTILAPQQRYRLNRNCLDNPLSVAGNPYAWCIGVHANSSLTYEVGGKWSSFESVIGIDDQMGATGSVVFMVSGDGKQLYKSPVIRGKAASATVVNVSIKGVKTLTLTVDATDDLDLGDVANWAGARLVR